MAQQILAHLRVCQGESGLEEGRLARRRQADEENQLRSHWLRSTGVRRIYLKANSDARLSRSTWANVH